MDTGQATPACYGQLDEMHKLIEELREGKRQVEAELAELHAIIDKHHTTIFSPKKEGTCR